MLLYFEPRELRSQIDDVFCTLRRSVKIMGWIGETHRLVIRAPVLMNDLYFCRVALFRNQSVSKSTGIKNQS